MWQFDGHVHSEASDGTDTLDSLARKAVQAGLDGFALTDHDVIPDTNKLTAVADSYGLLILPGIEVSTSFEGSSAHLLAYLPDAGSIELEQLLLKIRLARQERLQQIVEHIGADYPRVTWENLEAANPQNAADPDAPWGRPHVADLLVAEGIAANRSAAFEHILSPKGPYFVPQWAADPREAVEVVRRAGAVPVLAHPLSELRQRPLPNQVIAEMAEAGLFGLEKDHREHDEHARAQLSHLARTLGLVTTGGSDYHGAGKPNQLGENLTQREVIRAIVAEAGIELV